MLGDGGGGGGGWGRERGLLRDNLRWTCIRCVTILQTGRFIGFSFRISVRIRIRVRLGLQSANVSRPGTPANSNDSKENDQMIQICSITDYHNGTSFIPIIVEIE